MTNTYCKDTRNALWKAAAVAAVAFAVVLASSAQAAQPSDEAGVRQLFADFRAAFNTHDAHAAAALCTEDVDFLVASGDDVRGRTVVEQHLQPLFVGRLKSVDRETSLQEVRFLRPDVAVLVASYESRGIISPTGGVTPPIKGIYDWVVVRRAGSWRIAMWHEVNLPMQVPRS